MMQRFLLAVLFPLLSLAVVAAFAGALGWFFLYIEHAMHNEWGVIIVGMLLVVFVPAAAFMAQRAVEK